MGSTQKNLSLVVDFVAGASRYLLDTREEDTKATEYRLVTDNEIPITEQLRIDCSHFVPKPLNTYRLCDICLGYSLDLGDLRFSLNYSGPSTLCPRINLLRSQS